MNIDLVVTAIQDLVSNCTTISIKSAPDYPIENADPFPMSIVYVSGVSAYATNSTTTTILPTITLEIHLSRVNLKNTYIKLNALAVEIPKRLAGDPTLNGMVDTIVMTQGEPLVGVVSPFDWGSVKSEMLRFTIRFKALDTPIQP